MDEIKDKVKDGAKWVGQKAEKYAKIFAKRTSDAIATTKLSIAINEANNKIKDIYTQIGEAMYEDYLNDGNGDLDLTDSFEQIDRLMVDIGALYDKKAELKNATRCKKCGSLNDLEADFCSKCGAVLEAEDISAEDFEEEIEEEEIDEQITITPEKAE